MVKVKVENKEVTESENCPKLHKKRTKEAISVLKKLNASFSDNKAKKSLLDDSSESKVYLQVTLKKVPPKKMKSMIKVRLPHSLMTDTTEVCLITGDLEKNNKKAEIEPTVLHFKELLKKYGVKGIAEVVPLRQLRTEYKTFESKRQLSAAYDMFINDKKITACLPKVLGKAFYDNRKFPIPINLDTPNLKEQVERAISETVFSLSCRGNSCTSEIARLSMENNEILENILSCIEILSEKLPGKWANVLGVYIKTARSEAIPLYMSFENPNELKIKLSRHQEKAKPEELSTLPNAEVKVFKDGRIVVKNLPNESDEEEQEKEDIDITLKNDAVDDASDTVDDASAIEVDESAIEVQKIKRRKTKNSSDDKIVEIKKRKTNDDASDTVDDASAIEVDESAIEVQKIKRRKTKNSSNDKIVEIKKRKTNKRNNK